MARTSRLHALTSKGFSTRAVRDLLDHLASGPEPVTIYCIHDADASGTMIYHTLQHETKARPQRPFRIVNLGLEPWEALEMGLDVETFASRDRRTAVAAYVRERPDGEQWADWLQTHRVELNMMTTPQFIAWLDAKMGERESNKVIPPDEVLATTAGEQLSEHMRQIITDRILREARIDEQVTEALEGMSIPAGAELSMSVCEWLGANAKLFWRDYVDELVADLADPMS